MDIYIVPPRHVVLENLAWKAVWEAKQLSPSFEPFLVGVDRPLWTDVSANQGTMNLSIMAANDVQGVFARAGISWSYKDPTFSNVWDQAGNNNMYRSSYHVLYTDQSIINQISSWLMVHPKIDIIPRCIDLEVGRSDSFLNKANKTWEMVQRITDIDGVPPIIYSRYLIVNAWLSPYWTEEKLNSVKWFLAQYKTDRTSEHPGPPVIPNGVDEENVILQQTADKIVPWPGAATSFALDRDRWTHGDKQEMKIYIQNTWGGEVQEPPPFPIGDTMPLQDIMLKAKVPFQTGIALTGINQETQINVPNLPPNVKGLKLWLIVKSEKPGAFVFLSPGKFGEERYHLGARVQVANLEDDKFGDLLLDGNMFYRQHDAKGGTITYWLFITGYKVEVPEVDLSEINAKLLSLQNSVDALQSLNIDSRLKVEEAFTVKVKAL
jgi:hypothetical protein